MKPFFLLCSFVVFSLSALGENLLVYYLNGANSQQDWAQSNLITTTILSGGTLDTNYSGVTFPAVPDSTVPGPNNNYWLYFQTSNQEPTPSVSSAFTITAASTTYLDLSGCTLSFSWGGVAKNNSTSVNYSYALYYQATENGTDWTNWTQFSTGNAVLAPGNVDSNDFVSYQRVAADLSLLTSSNNYTSMSFGIAFFSPEGKGERKMATSNLKITQIPEPSAFALGMLFIGAAGLRRRRKS